MSKLLSQKFFHQKHLQTFDCNISAGIVLEGISHTKSIADIIADFRSVFIDISEEEIKKDIQECIQNFVEKELIILDA